MVLLEYKNRHSKIVTLKPTIHALKRFHQRYGLVFSKELPDNKVEAELANWFHGAQRKSPNGKKYKTRQKRHGKDSLYFVNLPFIFVVQSNRLMTVELGTRDTRHLNKRQLKMNKPLDNLNVSSKPTDFLNEKPYSQYKVTAVAYTLSGKRQLINLGSKKLNIDPVELNDKFKYSEFEREMMERLNEKSLNLSICAYFLRKHKNDIPAIVESQIN